MYCVNATLVLLLVLWVPFEHMADDLSSAAMCSLDLCL